MRFRNVIIFALAGILILSWFVIDRAMTPNQVILLEETQTASGLDISVSGNSIYYKNKEVIVSLTSLMRNKVARIDRTKNYDDYRNQSAILAFDYGYKGRSYLIDGEGRIVVSYRKYEFARDSWFIPYRFLGSNSDIVIYVTEPDQNVKALANQIRREMKI